MAQNATERIVGSVEAVTTRATGETLAVAADQAKPLLTPLKLSDSGSIRSLAGKKISRGTSDRGSRR
jgi:hypothetical protein